MRIVLGSASPRRLQLLRSLGLNVLVQPSAYHEPDLPNMSPSDAAKEHALQKCLDLRPSVRGELLVTADTIVDVDGVVFGKPKNSADAASMLRRLSGRRHLVHTAFAFAVPSIPEPVIEAQTTAVYFYQLAADEIERYVASGETMDKAGGYGIQGYGAALVERVEGDFYTVMGFPLGRFVRTLRRLGLQLPITK